MRGGNRIVNIGSELVRVSMCVMLPEDVNKFTQHCHDNGITAWEDADFSSSAMPAVAVVATTGKCKELWAECTGGVAHIDKSETE